MAAPNTVTWLPELKEGRDGPSQIIRLVNQLRRRLIGSSTSGGVSLFSTAIGRGDTLTTLTDGVELIGLSFVLPVVYSSFTINFGGEASDSASDGIFRVRLGGSYGVTNGTEIARFTATSTGFQPYSSPPFLVTGNTSTLIQMTLQSTVGHKAQFKGGFLVGN